MSTVLLIGCGSKKAPYNCAAQDLYVGSLFKSRRAYAEWRGLPWWIVSAAHGLLLPEARVDPYAYTLKGKPDIVQIAWAAMALRQITVGMNDDTLARDVCFEIHAGADYCRYLPDLLRACGFSTSRPVEGLGIGEQRGWYAKQVKHLVRPH